MAFLKSSLAKVTGTRFIQNILEKNVRASQYLMGIGSGGAVLTSGERAIFQILKQRSHPPYCIFDVGSNKGQFLRLLKKHMATEEFSVHCFEPGHETFQALADYCQQEERCVLNNVAISNQKGQAILHFENPGSSLASLTKRKLDHLHIDFGQSERVEVTTIDDYCAVNEIQHIHLLKIDIEGHELDALNGAKEMFARKSVDIVSFEFGGCNIDTRTFFKDFWYFFTNIDFNLFRITPSGYLYPIASYQETYEQFRTMNFVAIANKV